LHEERNLCNLTIYCILMRFSVFFIPLLHKNVYEAFPDALVLVYNTSIIFI
jgi:hypothetical protein